MNTLPHSSGAITLISIRIVLLVMGWWGRGAGGCIQIQHIWWETLPLHLVASSPPAQSNEPCLFHLFPLQDKQSSNEEATQCLSMACGDDASHQLHQPKICSHPWEPLSLFFPSWHSSRVSCNIHLGLQLPPEHQTGEHAWNHCALLSPVLIYMQT